MTTRGMGATEFKEIASIVSDCLLKPANEDVIEDCLKRVANLCESFPLYSHLKTPIAARV